MSPVFERAKTVHALDRAATVIGVGNLTEEKFCVSMFEFPTCE
jgi:hypothetical protein